MDVLVSICIPTYNGEKYLLEALNSVKHQTYKNIEVIISDDASTDSTLEICERFQKEVSFPVKIVNHDPSGIGANWNNCIVHSNGKFIKFLFQDDVLEQECVQKMLNYLIDYKLDFVASKRTIIDGQSQIVDSGKWFDNYGDLQKNAGFTVIEFAVLSKKTISKLNFGYIIHSNIIGEPCVTMFSRKLFDKIGPFNINMRQMLDYEYWIRVLPKYKLGIIEEKLVQFRVHDDQASHTNSFLNLDENRIIKETFYKYLIFYTSSDTIKSYLVEKYSFLRKMFLVKAKLNRRN